MDRPFWALLLLLSCTYSAALADDPRSESKGWGGMAPAPSENECRTFIEAALKEQRSHEEADGLTELADGVQDRTGEESMISEVDKTDPTAQVIEETTDDASAEDVENKDIGEEPDSSADISDEESAKTTDQVEQEETAAESVGHDDSQETTTGENASDEKIDQSEQKEEESEDSIENAEEDGSTETTESAAEESEPDSVETLTETGQEEVDSIEDENASKEEPAEADASSETAEETSTEQEEVKEEDTTEPAADQEQASTESAEVEDTSSAEGEGETEADQQSSENPDSEASAEEVPEAAESAESVESTPAEEKDETSEETTSAEVTGETANESTEQSEEQKESEKETPSAESTEGAEASEESAENQVVEEVAENSNLTDAEAVSERGDNNESSEQLANDEPVHENPAETSETAAPSEEQAANTQDETVSEIEPTEEDEEERPEQEDLTLKIEIPENLRSRGHIFEVLRLDSESVNVETKLLKAEETTLKDLKRLYEAAIKPLEILYKYRDLSNRHFGDSEIFSKPLILFMGPWSGGKSTIINYLLDNEYTNTALRTGAEPSPAYFNIVMWGEREEILDGTQLAADWTFSGLQKFGQGLLDRLRGLRMNNPLLEKVNIVEIPGILEIRKQVERLFPLNDACQWFIDRADIIFLVYDPSKLDVGPETEAILDQLKGREYQTKIILNKADQVKPEELMRVQGTLIWNISPLMSSTEPPVMYSTSLWSHPYQSGSPSRLLFAQERAFLKDFREAIDKRVENKISSARRFAVRVRNHAKMVDCYLTTYYNHKSFFGNRQKVSDDIIEHPQNYHIYEGLSTLTNISRYDLPDPDVYKDFFRLNPVYDFQQLASTCTYFKGCPINRLDVAIAYDLPELVGKYKKVAEDIVRSSKPAGKK